MGKGLTVGYGGGAARKVAARCCACGASACCATPTVKGSGSGCSFSDPGGPCRRRCCCTPYSPACWQVPAAGTECNPPPERVEETQPKHASKRSSTCVIPGCVRGCRDDVLGSLGRYAGSVSASVATAVRSKTGGKQAAAGGRGKDRADRATVEQVLDPRTRMVGALLAWWLGEHCHCWYRVKIQEDLGSRFGCNHKEPSGALGLARFYCV